MYKYNIKLYPEAIKKRDGLDLSSTKEKIREIAELFNVASDKVDNKKVIIVESLHIVGDTIEFDMYSDCWLEFPTRALRFFISRVARLEEYIPLITDNGRLFKGDSRYIEEVINDEGKKEVCLSEEELMIELVKLFHRKTAENKITINKIRRIMEER